MIVGAGASWPLPQTPHLTNIVCNQRVPISDTVTSSAYQSGHIVPLFECLRRARPRPELQNFETLMAAAWEIIGLEPDATGPSWISRALPNLSLQQIQSLCATGLSQAAHLIAVELNRCTEDIVRQGETPAIVPLLDQITEIGPTVVATLNYDDLAKKGCNPFYDGFSEDGTFDHEFACKVTNKNILLWLHGSIHMNVNGPVQREVATSSRRMGEIFWEERVDNALHGWVQGFRDSAINFPVVIAADKPRQLLRTPFLDYWHVLNRSLDSAKALIVIGYGGQDYHLNGILQDAVMRRGSDLRVVWCTSASSECDVLSVLARVFPTLINGYCPREPVVVGKSLQRIVQPTPIQPLPPLWVNPDGIDDLRDRVNQLLNIIT